MTDKLDACATKRQTSSIGPSLNRFGPLKQRFMQGAALRLVP